MKKFLEKAAYVAEALGVVKPIELNGVTSQLRKPPVGKSRSFRTEKKKSSAVRTRRKK